MGSLICVSGFFFGETGCNEAGAEFAVTAVQTVAAAATFTLSFDGSGGKDVPSAERMELLLRKALANPLGIVTTSIRQMHLTHPFIGHPAVWPQRAFSSEVSFEIFVAEGQDANDVKNQVFNILHPPSSESQFFEEVLKLDGFSVPSVKAVLSPHVLDSEVYISTATSTTAGPETRDASSQEPDNSSMITGLITFLVFAPCLCAVMAFWLYTEKKEPNEGADDGELSQIRL